MTSERQKLLAKVRALLAKTTENGCTEHEAMAALDRVRAMMDAYEVTEEELKLTKEEKAIIKDSSCKNDKNGIRSMLACGIGRFTGTQVWNRIERTDRGFSKYLVFCGMRGDVEFASWLLDHLEGFVRAELFKHLSTDVPNGDRRFAIDGFITGCCNRISSRLDALTQKSAAQAVGTKNALVVIKDAAIAEAMKLAGVELKYSLSQQAPI